MNRPSVGFKIDLGKKYEGLKVTLIKYNDE